MYPLLRFGAVVIKALPAPRLSMDAATETRFRCWPNDLDPFLEMNNGRILALYDLGRFDLALRTGLVRILFKKKWGLVVAGGSVRYRRRIRLFDRVTIRTRVVAFDERWIYIVQSMWVKKQPVSSVLLRTGVTGNGKAIPTARVRAAMRAEDWYPRPESWISEWIQADECRQWPP